MRPELEEWFKEEAAALSDMSIPYGVRLPMEEIDSGSRRSCTNPK
jgi:hypothetical protein